MICNMFHTTSPPPPPESKYSGKAIPSGPIFRYTGPIAQSQGSAVVIPSAQFPAMAIPHSQSSALVTYSALPKVPLQLFSPRAFLQSPAKIHFECKCKTLEAGMQPGL
jgi:hypothetical protein